MTFLNTRYQLQCVGPDPSTMSERELAIFVWAWNQAKTITNAYATHEDVIDDHLTWVVLDRGQPLTDRGQSMLRTHVQQHVYSVQALLDNDRATEARIGARFIRPPIRPRPELGLTEALLNRKDADETKPAV